MRHRLRKDRRAREGVAATETAVILPVFVVIVLGCIETCTMIFLKQSLEIAAYEACRTSLVQNTTTYGVTTQAQKILASRRIQNATITVTPSDFLTRPYGTFIKVTVSAPCASNSGFAPWIYAGRVLSSDVEMMKEY
jgi:Flp pilus assembly protein TadG